MPNKTVCIAIDVCAEMDRRRIKGQSYNAFLRNLLGLTTITGVKKPVEENPDYLLLAALAVGQSCLLVFDRPEPPRDEQGRTSLSWDSRPLNLRHLAQVVRRAEERLGYKFHVEGRPRGQHVTRVR